MISCQSRGWSSLSCCLILYCYDFGSKDIYRAVQYVFRGMSIIFIPCFTTISEWQKSRMDDEKPRADHILILPDQTEMEVIDWGVRGWRVWWMSRPDQPWRLEVRFWITIETKLIRYVLYLISSSIANWLVTNLMRAIYLISWFVLSCSSGEPDHLAFSHRYRESWLQRSQTQRRFPKL